VTLDRWKKHGIVALNPVPQGKGKSNANHPNASPRVSPSFSTAGMPRDRRFLVMLQMNALGKDNIYVFFSTLPCAPHWEARPAAIFCTKQSWGGTIA